MLAPSFALADDWVATKLRGRVLQLVDNQWAPLRRGDVVSDERVIRTIKGGRVTFQRGNETINLDGDTQIQIRDKSGRQFTTVQQYFGTVAIEADARQVNHFAVTTPHLAAVVKGTRFTVVSTGQGAKVSVQRGHVAVEDRDTQQTTLLAVGQSADTAKGTPLHVEGKGDLPVVYAANGKPVRTEATSTPSAGLTPKAAGAAAREAALAAGASRRQADQAAKAAEKEAKAAGKAAEKEAAATAYAEAVAAGASSKEAEKAAKEAAKEVKQEAKAAEHEARSESKGADNGNSGKGSDNGNSGKGSDHGKSDDTGGSEEGKGHGRSDDGGGSGNGNGGSDGSGDAGSSGSGGGSGQGGGGGDSGGSGSGSGGDSGGGSDGGGKGHGKKD
jgi:hypothetical protein